MMRDCIATYVIHMYYKATYGDNKADHLGKHQSNDHFNETPKLIKSHQSSTRVFGHSLSPLYSRLRA